MTVAGFIGFATWFLLVSFIVATETGSAQQYIVSEEELAAHLADGFTVVAVLESGRVVVE